VHKKTVNCKIGMETSDAEARSDLAASAQSKSASTRMRVNAQRDGHPAKYRTGGTLRSMPQSFADAY